MEIAFAKYLEQLIQPTDRILLAVSGGVDSMVMADLFLKAGKSFAVAHCNFQLRGANSELDEELVKIFATTNEIEFHSIRFETSEIAQNRKQGIQETARDLRYNWFKELSQQSDYQLIATAHHADDSIETALFNLVRGTGLSGLTGIAAKRDSIIRPLIHFRKSEILAFAERHKIEFREDRSNQEDKYNRNHLRLNVIPSLKKINPSFEETMSENLDRLDSTNDLYQFLLKKLALELIKKEGAYWKISKSKIHTLPQPTLVIYELVKDFGFHFPQAKSIFESLENQPGAIFSSESHELLNDRTQLIIRERQERWTVKSELKENETIEITNTFIISGRKENQIPEKITAPKNEAWLDFDSLEFPLVIENWQPGDRFQPIGMNGQHQKIQDFLSNNKYSLFEKESVLVLKSQGKICWVIGQRLSEPFKITSNTSAAYHIIVKNQK